jgi:acylphosphatase
MTTQDQARLYAIVKGRVQGVGYRYFVMEIALALELTGWVRNRWDETVEVTAEGEQGRLHKLLAALQRGPSAAYVSAVDVDWQVATGEFSSFRVRATE